MQILLFFIKYRFTSSRFCQVNLKSLIINSKIVFIEDNKEEIPATMPVQVMQNKASKPAPKLIEKYFKFY